MSIEKNPAEEKSSAGNVSFGKEAYKCLVGHINVQL